jgi:hypothetical protein
MDDDVAALLDLQERADQDATCFQVSLKAGATQAELAKRLATMIARGLLEPVPHLFHQWCQRAGGGAPHGQTTKDVLTDYLLADFAPSAKEVAAGSTRLRGAVVEHLWVAISMSVAGGWGGPLYVERDHFSVIDHGADGVSLYEVPDDHAELRFRLWESKRHASNDSVTNTITGAANQLDSDGGRYVARLSKPMQLHHDRRVQVLAGKMAELWRNHDDRSAVGVSIGRSTGDALPKRPFIGLKRKFDYLDGVRREGVIIEVADLSGFAEDVRAWLERGIA